MKHKNIFLLSLLILAAACSGGSGGGSGGSDSISSNPITAGDPLNADPVNHVPGYNFDGSYSGDCVVKAVGMTSRSCSASINIYHEGELQTFSMMGNLEVDMGFVYNNFPVVTDPLEIKNRDLISAGDGQDMGDIDANGFTAKSSETDFVKFTKTGEESFFFQGEYQDPTYGKVLVEGNLQKIQ